MTASAHDIASALRERLPGIGKKKLHKLLYYCQGHHLATFGRPLFSEQIYAWDMGPVVAALSPPRTHHRQSRTAERRCSPGLPVANRSGGWNLSGFDEHLDLWQRLADPADELRILVTAWVLSSNRGPLSGDAPRARRPPQPVVRNDPR